MGRCPSFCRPEEPEVALDRKISEVLIDIEGTWGALRAQRSVLKAYCLAPDPLPLLSPDARMELGPFSRYGRGPSREDLPPRDKDVGPSNQSHRKKEPVSTPDSQQVGHNLKFKTELTDSSRFPDPRNTLNSPQPEGKSKESPPSVKEERPGASRNPFAYTYNLFARSLSAIEEEPAEDTKKAMVTS